MRYRVTHRTRYRYDSPVTCSQHLAHLAPRHLPHQRVGGFDLRIEPRCGELLQHHDYFGNATHWFEVIEEHSELIVSARSTLEVLPRPSSRADTLDVGSWEECRTALSLAGAYPEVQDYLLDSPLVRRNSTLAELGRETFTPGRSAYEAVTAFNAWIHEGFRYDPTATEVSTPLAQVIEQRVGVCQDFAHLAVGCLRSLGLAARYVSGYLETTPPAGKPRLVGADASHAWASVFLPPLGWLDFDPTNAVLPDERHITVAWGRDFTDVSPLKGVVLGGGSHVVEVGVDVEPLSETAHSPASASDAQSAPSSSSDAQSAPSSSSEGQGVQG